MNVRFLIILLATASAWAFQDEVPQPVSSAASQTADRLAVNIKPLQEAQMELWRLSGFQYLGQGHLADAVTVLDQKIAQAYPDLFPPQSQEAFMASLDPVGARAMEVLDLVRTYYRWEHHRRGHQPKREVSGPVGYLPALTELSSFEVQRRLLLLNSIYYQLTRRHETLAEMAGLLGKMEAPPDDFLFFGCRLYYEMEAGKDLTMADQHQVFMDRFDNTYTREPSEDERHLTEKAYAGLVLRAMVLADAKGLAQRQTFYMLVLQTLLERDVSPEQKDLLGNLHHRAAGRYVSGDEPASFLALLVADFWYARLKDMREALGKTTDKEVTLEKFFEDRPAEAKRFALWRWGVWHKGTAVERLNYETYETMLRFCLTHHQRALDSARSVPGRLAALFRFSEVLRMMLPNSTSFVVGVPEIGAGPDDLHVKRRDRLLQMTLNKATRIQDAYHQLARELESHPPSLGFFDDEKARHALGRNLTSLAKLNLTVLQYITTDSLRRGSFRTSFLTLEGFHLRNMLAMGDVLALADRVGVAPYATAYAAWETGQCQEVFLIALQKGILDGTAQQKYRGLLPHLSSVAPFQLELLARTHDYLDSAFPKPKMHLATRANRARTEIMEVLPELGEVMLEDIRSFFQEKERRREFIDFYKIRPADPKEAVGVVVPYVDQWEAALFPDQGSEVGLAELGDYFGEPPYLSFDHPRLDQHAANQLAAYIEAVRHTFLTKNKTETSPQEAPQPAIMEAAKP